MLTGGIGFFDSGVGGLSVLSACLQTVGDYPIYYYGDNQRAPYGNRSFNEIRAYVREAFSFLSTLRPRAVVVACNTVTALMIDELREIYSFPIIGVEPAVLPAVRRGGKVLVLATKATAESLRIKRLIDRAKRFNPEAEVTVKGCPRLAAMVEGGFQSQKIDFEAEFPPVNADRVVLGCTHYSFLKERISRFYGAEVFDGNAAVAKRLQFVLSESALGGRLVNDCKGESLAVRMLRRLPFIRPFKKPKKGGFRVKKGSGFRTVKNALLLYFVGSGSSFNCQFYERMFVFGKKG